VNIDRAAGGGGESFTTSPGWAKQASVTYDLGWWYNPVSKCGYEWYPDIRIVYPILFEIEFVRSAIVFHLERHQFDIRAETEQIFGGFTNGGQPVARSIKGNVLPLGVRATTIDLPP
jgi:hypothetical protein